MSVCHTCIEVYSENAQNHMGSLQCIRLFIFNCTPNDIN